MVSHTIYFQKPNLVMFVYDVFELHESTHTMMKRPLTTFDHKKVSFLTWPTFTQHIGKILTEY